MLGSEAASNTGLGLDNSTLYQPRNQVLHARVEAYGWRGSDETQGTALSVKWSCQRLIALGLTCKHEASHSVTLTCCSTGSPVLTGTLAHYFRLSLTRCFAAGGVTEGALQMPL